jgi:hypothetical protein
VASWRVAADDINYRRFFNIPELAGLRIEHEAVFAEAHRWVLPRLRDGTLARPAHRPRRRPVRPDRLLRAPARGRRPAVPALRRKDPGRP